MKKSKTDGTPEIIPFFEFDKIVITYFMVLFNMTKKMFFLMLMFAFGGVLPCHAIEVNVSLDRQTASVGEMVALTLTVAGREQPRLLNQKPVEHMRWLSGSRTSVSIINGRAETSTTYYFQPLAEGMLEIPPLEAAVGRETAKTPTLRLRVIKGDDVDVSRDDGSRQAEAIRDVVFGRGRILVDGTGFYVGEEIPLEIKLFYPRDLNLEPTGWPIIEPDNVIFKDYGSCGARNNPRFEPPSRDVEQFDGRLFNVYRFRTAFRCIAPGVLRPAATIATEVKVPERRQRSGGLFDRDDFFSGFLGRSRYRSIAHTVRVEFPELTVKELPPPPKHADYLGLVGNWHVSFDLIDEGHKVGEPMTLKMEIKGIGTLDTLSVPRLEIKGFRVYPPEIDKSQLAATGNQHATVKYVLIPTRPGGTEIGLNVAIYSSPLHKYQEFGFNRKIEIGDSSFHAGEAASADASSALDFTNGADAGRRPDQISAQRTRSSILYLKTQPSGGVATPLYRNWLLWYLFLGIAGPLAWLISELIWFRKFKLSNNAALRRRVAALARRARVIKAVNSASSEEMALVMQKEVVPYLNDMLNLPPGTDAATLADKIGNPDLATCLKNASESSYMPGAINEHTPASKSKIIRSLKRISGILLAVCLPLLAEARTDNGCVTTAPIETFAEALNAYDRGYFQLAADFFRQQIDAEFPDPALLYNLGNCLCQMEDYAGALVCFERARLLAPMDSAIAENLNFVRRKLFLPEVGVVRHPGDLLVALRDLLRPDQWLLLAGIVWFMTGIVFAFRRRLSSNKMVVLSTLCGLTFALSMVAYLTQEHGSYSPANAIVVVDNTELRSLPSQASGRMEMKLRGGTHVRIVEPRMEWVRINVDGHEGWVYCDNIISIAPGGRIP